MRLPVLSDSRAPLSACAMCATLQKTCCQRAEVFVSAGDRFRIECATGRSDFWEFRAPVDLTLIDHPRDSIWIKGTVEPNGTRPVLKRHASGDCTFLGEKGCTLDSDVRPLVCRLYPYEYTESGLHGVSAEYCPSAVIPEGKTMLQVLNMSLVDAMRWHRMLYFELRTKEVYDEDRDHIRSAS